jgi:hypothetical protein
MKIFKAICVLAFVLPSIAASAADYPAPKQGEWTAHEFVFHTGEVMSNGHWTACSCMLCIWAVRHSPPHSAET